MAKRDPYNLDTYADEVKSGLPSVKNLLDDALENQAFYDHDGERYLPRREAETEFDYLGRPKRQSGLTAQVIEVLTEHLYNPGPSRSFDDEAGEAFLQQVWTDNLVNALMQHADELATLNHVAAIQIDAGTGDYANRPITLRLWGREEFHVWTDPDDATCPAAVVTVDRYDTQTRYRLWNDVEVRTYLTTRTDGQTAGGTAAVETSREPNSYGVIPFGFVHYRLPMRRFFTPGLGTFLRKTEVRVDDRLSQLDESILKHLNPIPVAQNVPLEWNPVLEPGRFLRLFSAGPQIGVIGGFDPSASTSLFYLQAHLDVAGAWEDLTNYVNTVFEACRIPLSAIRMDQARIPSGIALVAEQAPLLTRSRARRGIFGHFEQKIAQTILRCAGNHYGKPELLRAAESGNITLAWSEPTVPIPGPDRDECDANAIAMGVKSRLMVIQDRYGCTRDQAVEILKQVAEDAKDEASILPHPDSVIAIPPEAAPQPGQQPEGVPVPPTHAVPQALDGNPATRAPNTGH